MMLGSFIGALTEAFMQAKDIFSNDAFAFKFAT